MISIGISDASTSKFFRLSLIHIIAASVHKCARSAPTYPCVSLAIISRFKFSSSFMLRVCMLRISNRPVSSGTPMSISLSNRPKRLNEVSTAFGLFVAPITITLLLPFIPSIRVSS